MRYRIDLAFRVTCRPQRCAIVEIGAPVPLAIPGVLLDILADMIGFRLAALAEGGVTMKAGYIGEPDEHVVKEESQPDAFAFAFFAHLIHTVVPVARAHQGQSVLAKLEALLNGSDAVFVQTG